MDRGYTDYDWWEDLTQSGRLSYFLSGLSRIKNQNIPWYICKCGYDSGVGRTLFISDFSLHSMREILNWIRINLFLNEIFDDYLIPKMTESIVNPQLALF